MEASSLNSDSAASSEDNLMALVPSREGIEGSPQATARLRKELTKIWHSEAFRKKFLVEPIEGSLYEWNVRLLLQLFDRDSSLYQDLLEVQGKTGKEGILLHFQFKDTYPSEPPFVRVVEPLMYEGYIYKSAVCIEVLMPQRWNPDYSLEVLFMEIAASITRGDGRVVFDDEEEHTVARFEDEQTLEKALEAFKQLQIMPDAGRWTSLYKPNVG